MAFTITNEETARLFSFADEAAWEAALDWYNTTPKAEIIAFCAANGVDLSEDTGNPYFRSGRKLVDDWADVAMELRARVQ